MTREQRSILWIKAFEPKAGYRVCNSGGKDSTVIMDLMKRSGVEFHSHFNLSGVDPSPLLDYIKKYHPDTIWYKPEKLMFELIEEKGLLTKRKRWCTKYLKCSDDAFQISVKGLRAEESLSRASRRSVFEMFNNSLSFNPIFYWSEHQIWKYIHLRNVPYCDLYKKGFSRIGCVGCPFSGFRSLCHEFYLFPEIKQGYIDVIQKLLDKGWYSMFTDPKECFDWWLRGIPLRSYFYLKKNNNLIDISKLK